MFLDSLEAVVPDARLGETAVERSSSPIIHVSAGTIIGSTSWYLPVATLISEFLINLAGIFVATPAVIASVTIFTSPEISVLTDSASSVASVCCVTIAVELSPFNV